MRCILALTLMMFASRMIFYGSHFFVCFSLIFFVSTQNLENEKNFCNDVMPAHGTFVLFFSVPLRSLLIRRIFVLLFHWHMQDTVLMWQLPDEIFAPKRKFIVIIVVVVISTIVVASSSCFNL